MIEMNEECIRIKTSDKWLRFRIIAVLVFSWALWLFLRLVVKDIVNYDEAIEDLFLMVLLFTIIFVSIFVPLYLVVKDKKEYFEINNNELVSHKGIILSVTKSYSFNLIGSIESVQTGVGKYFDFGTVIMNSSNTSEPAIRICEVSDPDKVMRILREKVSLLKQKNPKSENDTLLNLVQ